MILFTFKSSSCALNYNNTQMKHKKLILENIAYRHHIHNIRRECLKKEKRRREYEEHLPYLSRLGGKPTVEKIIQTFLSVSTRYLLECTESPFFLGKLQFIPNDYASIVSIPENFSLVENPKDSYNAISKVITSFFFHRNPFTF